LFTHIARIYLFSWLHNLTLIRYDNSTKPNGTSGGIEQRGSVRGSGANSRGIAGKEPFSNFPLAIFLQTGPSGKNKSQHRVRTLRTFLSTYMRKNNTQMLDEMIY
jgi:hypothetical protein